MAPKPNHEMFGAMKKDGGDGAPSSSEDDEYEEILTDHSHVATVQQQQQQQQQHQNRAVDNESSTEGGELSFINTSVSSSGGSMDTTTTTTPSVNHQRFSRRNSFKDDIFPGDVNNINKGNINKGNNNGDGKNLDQRYELPIEPISMESSDNDDDDGDVEDDDTHQEAKPDSGAAGSSPDSDNEELAETETRWLKRSKVFFFIVLLIAAASSSYVVYYIADTNEENAFHKRYREAVSEIVAKANENVEELASDIDTAALHITSIARAIPDTDWPNITIPGFEALAKDLQKTTGNFYLIMLVHVANEQRASYEQFHANNTGWIEEALEYQGRPVEPTLSELTRTKSRVIYGGASPEVVEHLDDYKPATTYPGLDFFVPVAQTSPIESVYIFNFDALGNGPFRQTHLRSQKARRGLFGYVEARQVDEPTDDPLLGPSIYYDTPIWKTLQISQLSKDGDASGEMVGSLGTQIPWTPLFNNIYDRTTEAISLVIRNDCNASTTVTFEVEGPVSTFWGVGDHHDDIDGKDTDKYLETQPFESMSELSQCRYTFHAYPTQAFFDEYHTNQPFVNAIAVSITFVVTALAFVLYDYLVENRQSKILKVAARSATIVSSLFPQNVRDRLLNDGDRKKKRSKKSKRGKSKKNSFVGTAPTPSREFGTDCDSVDTTNWEAGHSPKQARPRPRARLSQRIIRKKSKPIADLFPHVTVLFADVVGFTAWSSVRQPAEVFELLEAFFACFDKIARRLQVFKVETVGDCYVAVTGLPESMPDHAVVMTRFAIACVARIEVIVRKLAVTLGPDTTELKMRLGLHSGPVTAGVLRGDKSRFQLFGDTVNTAARMEQTGIPNRIQVSQETADELIEAGKALWIMEREDQVMAKGKGSLQTYWVVRGQREMYDAQKKEAQLESTNGMENQHSDDDSIAGSIESSSSETNSNSQFDSSESISKARPSPKGSNQLAAAATTTPTARTRKTKAYRIDAELEIQWNVDVLHTLLRKIVSMRDPKSGSRKVIKGGEAGNFRQPGESSFDELTEVIQLPNHAMEQKIDPQSVKISPQVLSQVEDFVRTICNMYQDNSFHGFSHASHVVQSTIKLLSRIVTADSIDYKAMRYTTDTAKDLHKYTFGITSDPITQFACVFAALIHDVDHQGVPNTQLAKEKTPLAEMYKNKSIAEQNSLDLAWDLLMEPRYADFRACIYQTKEELERFRKLMVNMVLATDIMDKDLGVLRKERWDTAFQQRRKLSGDANAKSGHQQVANRMATIVIEHLIQASDVAHTMQHWHIYVKWNEKLFHEMYKAYQMGRSDTDPSVGWYQGEMGFFDFYIIPLARKLQECGVFGVSSAEYLNYAKANRKEWETRGEESVVKYLKNYTGPRNK